MNANAGRDTIPRNAIHDEMETLVTSVERLVERFTDLTNPITESTSQVPEATQQLEKVNRQTEKATHQVLDTVERMVERDTDLLDGLKAIREHIGDDEGMRSRVDTLAESAQSNLDDAFDIMNTLQFQDITAQQLQHAAQVLHEIQSRLHKLVHSLEDENAETPAPGTPRSYDPNASFIRNGNEQAEVDALVEKVKPKQ